MRRLSVVIVALSVVVGACGDSSGDDGAAATTSEFGETTTTQVPRTTTTTQVPLTTTTLSLTEGVSYTSTNQLDVIAPGDSGPWPTVVLVHGFDMSRHSMNSLAEAIAEGGAVVFNISIPHNLPFLDSVEHVACAVRFARAETANYGGTPEHLVLAGYSFSAWAGSVVSLGGDGLDSECVASGSSEPDAFVGYEGSYDGLLTSYFPDPNDEYFYDPDVWRAESPEVWEELNPYVMVGNNPDLRVRLIHGVDDDRFFFDILPAVSEDFQEALRDSGYDVTLVMVDGATSTEAYRPRTVGFDAMLAEVLAAAGDAGP